MPRRFIRTPLLTCLVLTCLVLVGCQRHSVDASGGATPVQAVRRSIALIRAGRFEDFVRQALPPADYARLRADWHRDPISEQPFPVSLRDRADRIMQALIAPDASTRINAQLLPKLAAAQDNYGDQMLVIIGVGQALLDKRVKASATLTANQKQQMHEVLAALAPWARTVRWFDPDRARHAIARAVSTARTLKVTRAEQLQALDFDAAMATYGQLFDGAEKLLAIYGLSIENTLASATVTPLTSADDHPHQASVRIDYVLAGTHLSARMDMVELDGRWYSQAAIRAARAQFVCPAMR